MIKKIKNSLIHLDKSKRDIFELAEKTLQLLSNQLIAAENAGYFNLDGSEKAKYFIEQFIMVSEFYPIDFGSYGMVDFGISFDSILERLYNQSYELSLNQTNNLINFYLYDIQEKETDENFNNLQHLSASLTKIKLQSAFSSYNGDSDPQAEMAKLLKKVKSIIDFFYSQLNHLSGSSSNSSMIDSRPQTMTTSRLSIDEESLTITSTDNQPTTIYDQTTVTNPFDYASEISTVDIVDRERF